MFLGGAPKGFHTSKVDFVCVCGCVCVSVCNRNVLQVLLRVPNLIHGVVILGILVCLWTFKWVGGPLVGDFGCAGVIVESANPKNLD